MTRRKPADWADLKLGKGARLLLGWRDGRRNLNAQAARMTADVSKEMIAACRGALSRIGQLDRRIYSGIPALEPEQYLSLTIATGSDGAISNDVDTLQKLDRMMPEEAAATAELVELVHGAFDEDEWLTKDELAMGSWLFYAVVVQLDGGGVAAFVRKYNPQRGLKAGRLRLAANGDTLARFDDPLFNFDFNFDLIIAPNEIAIFSVTAFNSVFADIELAKIHASEHVTTITSGIVASLSDSSEALFRKECEERASFANRARRLAHVDYLSRVTPAALRDALQKHGMKPDRLGKAKIKLGSREDVEVFLDLVEGLYYEADFTGEARRADRYSVRR
ncbi:MAG TPA: hypothetical protein VGX69_03260 [Solirubrobacteraceae bacterium]|nr:hypothetical protein [Solirubrobacteraceae bacterium]